MRLSESPRIRCDDGDDGEVVVTIAVLLLLLLMLLEKLENVFDGTAVQR